MPLLSCCRPVGSTKAECDDHPYYATAPTANPKRTAKPKSNVVASSESLGPPKSTNYKAYDTKSNQEAKSPVRQAVAFSFNGGSTESADISSSDLYNKTDDPVKIEQWMAIYREAKNQTQQLQLSKSQSTMGSSTAGGSSTYIASNDRLTIGESGVSIDDCHSTGGRLPAMQSLGVLPTRPATLSRQTSHTDYTDNNELEKSHSVAYLADKEVAAREGMQRTPPLLRSPEVEEIRKKTKRLKFNVQRSPDFEDLSHIDTDSE